MNDPKDKKEFAEIVGTVMILYNKDATQLLLRLYWNTLVNFSIEEVRWAFDYWVKDPKQGTFMPKPADIIRTIQEATQGSQPQWITANEAWALALPAIDEKSTVVWTPEIAKAFEVARPILEDGDKIGARMAFIPAYDRIINQAKLENRTPSYEVSAGWCPHNRDLAIQNAVTVGLLPPPKNDPVMLAPPDETPAQRKAREAEEKANRERLQAQLKDLAKALKDNEERAQREAFERHKAAQKVHEDRKAELINQLQQGEGS